MDWSQRISQLSPEQQKQLLQKLEERNIDILQLPITPLERKEGQRFPLSFGQERLWFVHQLDPGNFAYNIIRTTWLEGILDKPSLERSLNEIVHRHEILRTQFTFDQDKPVQYILPELTLPLETVDLKNLPGPQQEEEAAKIILAEIQYNFDLAACPLLKTKLLELQDNVHVFILMIHHIVSDATSIQVFLKELFQSYQAFSRGDIAALPPLPIQYVDYVCWQQQWFGNNAFQSGWGKKQETYWLEQFKDEIPILTIPIDFPRPRMQSFEGNQWIFKLEAGEARILKQLILKERSTLYIFLLAVYNIFLAKLSGMEDIVVGTPVSGRRHPALQGLIGMFVNTLALRNFPYRYKKFAEFLEEVKARTLSAFENQEYRYEDIVDKLNINRDIGRNPLFDVALLVDLNDLENFVVHLPGLNLKLYERYTHTSKFDLTLIALEEEDRLKIIFEYCTKLFNKASIERFAGYFKEILTAVTKNWDIEIGDIDIIPDEEKRRILFEFNRTEADFPQDKKIFQLLARQVDKTPDRVALVFEDSHLCYRELDQKAQRLAITLRDRGLKPGGIVGIMGNPSLDLVIGIIGIMKARGAYLPINPDYPWERIDYMLKDSGAEILIGRVEKKKNLEINFIDSLESSNFLASSLPDFLAPNSSNLAYILYTSGSTGGPKGVMVEHCSVVNILWDLFQRYPLEERDAYLFKTAFTFDVSVSELFGWFWRGGHLVILKNEDRKDPEKIVAAAAAHHITHINFVPPMFSLWLEFLNDINLKRLASLKYIFVAGEALLPQSVTKFKDLGTRIILENIYGPTEATIYASRFSLAEWDGGDRVPIGKAFANVKLYILDRNRNLQPIGVAGELYIAGLGLARGYLNNPELTAEKFINFYHSSFIIHHSKLYRTGDLARWLPDGNVEYLGRVDFQVKIRGFRIELGEIENLLLSHQDVMEAVVVARESENKDRSLCAYIVTLATDSNHPDNLIEGLREHLSRKLPDFMIPNYFVLLEKIPLTASGKVDRKALPQPEFKRLENNYEPPRDEIEARLIDVWQEVLGLESVGINDHFFIMGGDSIKAIQVSARLKKYGLELKVADFFLYSTVKELGKRVTRSDSDGESEEQEILTQLDYWQAVYKEAVKVTPLPTDREIGSDLQTNESWESLEVTLEPGDTERLLHEVNWAYNTEINDILLTALSLAVREWARVRKVCIHLEEHGRESISEDFNISRTGVRYSTLYPVVFEGAGNKPEDLSYEIKNVKETLRRVPGKGIGYGILKYSTPQEKKGGYRFDLDSEIVFNYLGKFGEDMGKINPGSTNRFKLYIEGILQDDRLRFSFTYNKFQYKRESIERLIGYYKSSLLKIIEHCCNKMEKESTPSDLGYSDISIEQLEEFENDLSDID